MLPAIPVYQEDTSYRANLYPWTKHPDPGSIERIHRPIVVPPNIDILMVIAGLTDVNF